MYQKRSENQATPVPDPVPPSTIDEDNPPAYDGPDLTPVKFRRMNTFTARQNIIMAAAQHVCWTINMFVYATYMLWYYP